MLLLASLAFVAAGVWMIGEGNAAGWFVAGFFGLCALPAVWSLWPNASYLLLTPEGFTVKTPFRSWSLRWDDVEEFGAESTGRTTIVTFDFAPGFDGHAVGRRLNNALGFRDAGLGDTYGLSAEELADLMNEWRSRYARRQSGEDVSATPATVSTEETVGAVFGRPPGRDRPRFPRFSIRGRAE